MQLSYSPNGKAIVYTTTGRTLGVLNFGKTGDETREQWRVADLSGVRLLMLTTVFYMYTHITTTEDRARVCNGIQSRWRRLNYHKDQRE